MGKLKVAVLMGGRSEEREISIRTGSGVLRALDPERYDAVAIDTDRSEVRLPPASTGSDSQDSSARVLPASMALEPGGVFLCDLLARGSARPDVVFISLHGRYGEDGTVQGMLELLGIPYTGSGVLASALAMDKATTKKLLQAEEIPTPPFVVLDDASKAPFIADYFALPLVVKPNQQGSSYGLTIVRERDHLPAAVELALRYDRSALVEKYVSGREITAAVLGNRDPEVLPLVEIEPRGEFYDFDSKYTPGHTDFHIPARLTTEQSRRATDYALRAHVALGCAGVTRIDMIVDDEGVWVLEINTIPGMTATSLVPKAAAAAGIPYSELCDRLIELAFEQSETWHRRRDAEPLLEHAGTIIGNDG